MKERPDDLVDQMLVMRAQDGDRRSLDGLVERWQQRLWQHARRLTGSAEVAWDITQQAWLAVIRGLDGLHDPARFRQWAYRITTNKAMDHLKARRPRPLPEEPLPEPPPRSGSSQSTADLLAALDPEKRIVVTLYYFDAFNVAEISAILGIPPGTVKSRLHTARRELRKRLGEGDD